MSRVLAFLELTGAAPAVIEDARGRMRVVSVDVRAPRLGWVSRTSGGWPANSTLCGTARAMSG
jgi:hypothetical protein